MKPLLNVDLLSQEAKYFAQIESNHDEPLLYGVTDGKAVGTYFEQKFKPTYKANMIIRGVIQLKELIFQG